MASKYQHEVDKIESIRGNNRNVPQLTLAKQIKRGDFANLGYFAGGARTVLSIYSVIRRLDARLNKAVSKATATA